MSRENAPGRFGNVTAGALVIGAIGVTFAVLGILNVIYSAIPIYWAITVIVAGGGLLAYAAWLYVRTVARLRYP